TSASAAENQNESLNIKTIEPTNPLPKAIKDWDLESATSKAFSTFSFCLVTKNILLTKWVMVQNKNIMVSALQVADIELIASAYLLPSPNAKPAQTAPMS